MPWWLVRQPSGGIARYSTVVYGFTHYGMTDEEVLRECGGDLAEFSARVRGALDDDPAGGGGPVGAGAEPTFDGFRRWRSALQTIRAIHGERAAKEAEQEAAKNPGLPLDPYVTGRKRAEEVVSKLGEAIGYGHMMQLAEKLWAASLEEKGHPRGGEFAAYCCTSFMVPCGCAAPSGCAWCCGTGRIVQHVKLARDALTELAAVARATVDHGVVPSQGGAFLAALDRAEAALKDWKD